MIADFAPTLPRIYLKNKSVKICNEYYDSTKDPSQQLKYFVVDGSQTVSDMKSIMSAHLRKNNLDELLVRDINRKLYLVYGHDFSNKVKEGAEFACHEFRGTVLAVDRELSRDKNGIKLAMAVVTGIAVLASLGLDYLFKAPVMTSMPGAWWLYLAVKTDKVEKQLCAGVGDYAPQTDLYEKLRQTS